ncbi:MAG: ROK family protein [bacterium]|nr:ROK family protein [bacterium]
MYIALDIGGTNTRVGSFTSLDSNTLTEYIKFKTKEDYTRGLRNITDAISKFSNNEKLDAIGVSIASGISADGKTVVDPNIPAWKAESLLSDLKSEYKIPVNIINDGTAGGIAESVWGNGKNLKSFTFLTWGTGLGGVTVEKLGNQLVVYEYEPGHLNIGGDGRKCRCGKVDCIESYVGGYAVEKRLNKKMSELSREEWDTVLECMEKGILKILEKHPVDYLILDGNVIIKHPDFIKNLEKRLKGFVNNITLLESSIGDKAPLYGTLMTLNTTFGIELHKDF